MPNKYCKKEECQSDEELLALYHVYGSEEDETMNICDLHSLFKDCELEMTPFEARIMFNFTDTDMNGKVTFPEFKRMMTKFVDEDFSETFFVDLFVAFLRTLDSDGSGYISKNELETALEEKIEEGEFEIFTIMFDEDGDGRISVGEAAKALIESGEFFSK